MKRIFQVCAFLLVSQTVFGADLRGKWVLEKCSLTYHVNHPLHLVQGTSLSAKGKGIWDGKGFEFLVAVPVKSFESGRDMHMLQTVRAGTYPMIQVHIRSVRGQEKGAPKRIIVDALVDFAGKSVSFPGLSLEVVDWSPAGASLKGTLPLTLKGFDIPAPSLLSMPVEDSVPVEMEMAWKPLNPQGP